MQSDIDVYSVINYVCFFPQNHVFFDRAGHESRRKLFGN